MGGVRYTPDDQNDESAPRILKYHNFDIDDVPPPSSEKTPEEEGETMTTRRQSKKMSWCLTSQFWIKIAGFVCLILAIFFITNMILSIFKHIYKTKEGIDDSEDCGRNYKNFVNLNGTCYLFVVDKSLTKSEALRFCKKFHGASLLTIKSQQEQNEITNYTSQHFPKAYFWLGLKLHKINHNNENEDTSGSGSGSNEDDEDFNRHDEDLVWIWEETFEKLEFTRGWSLEDYTTFNLNQCAIMNGSNGAWSMISCHSPIITNTFAACQK